MAALSGRSIYTEEHRAMLVADAVSGLDLRESDELLDVGCAAGFTGEPLARRVRRYVGIDYSAGAIARFRARCPWLSGGIRWGSALDLSQFGAGEFSKGHMGSVLLCLSVDECAQALRELRRVVRERAFVAGNLEADGQSHTTWFARKSLADLALACGWSLAIARDLHPALPHAATMFDLVVWA